MTVCLDYSVQFVTKIVIHSIDRGLFCNKICNPIIVYNFRLIIGLLMKLESNKLDFLGSFHANYISSRLALHSMKSDNRKFASSCICVCVCVCVCVWVVSVFVCNQLSCCI
jgi:hypothetical protein